MPLPVYEPGSALEYVTKQNWKHKRSGDEIVLQTCPFCGRNDFKHYVSNATGLFTCHHAKCGKHGNWFQFLRELGELPAKVARPLAHEIKQTTRRFELSTFQPYEEALANDASVVDYLASRGLTLDTAKAWHLGTKVDDKGIKWLMFPFVTTTGEIADVKYRTLPPEPKRFRRMGGGDSILYGEHELAAYQSAPKRILYMVEGEADQLTLWQHGFRPVVSTTAGAGTFKPRWHDLIVNYDPGVIVVVYDNDVAGQKGAESVIRKFDDRQVLNVVLPDGCKDANEYFLTHTKEDFDQLLTDTQPAQIESVLPMVTVLDMLEEQLFMGTGGCDGLSSQFSDLNDLIAGGYWNGSLTTISGIASVGKTTLALQELLHQADQGNPTYLMCLEMPETMIMRKVISHKYHIAIPKITLSDVQRVRGDLEKLPFYMGYKGGAWDKIEKDIRAAVKRFDLRMIAFDNVNYFIRTSQNVAAEIGLVTKRLKELAVDLQIPILLIAQPRKFDDNDRMMTMNDLKDSSSIAQDSDNVILLWRRRLQSSVKDSESAQGFQGAYSRYATLRVDKSRYSAGGELKLIFDGEVSSYRPLTDDEKTALATKKDITS